MDDQNSSKSPKRLPADPWRVERMEQRVPGHIDEPRILSPWLLIGGLGVLTVFGCILLFVSYSGGFAGSTAQIRTPTRDIVVTLPSTTAATVSPALSPTNATAAPTPSVIRYTVKKGDTLSLIAQKYKVSVEAIRAVNNLTGDTIRENDVLVIPLPTPTPASAPRVTPTPLAFGTPTLIALIPTATPLISPTPTATPGFVAYSVKSGDTLIQIAGAFSTTVQSIIDLNGLVGANIRAGQVLTVPIGAVTLTPTPTVFLIPTATPTTDFIYKAPILNWPPDGREFASTDYIQVSWLSVGALKTGEQYVVNLKYTCADKEFRLSSAPTQGTAYQFVNKSPCPANSTVTIAWYVLVVRQGGCLDRLNPYQPCAVSPVSETRTLIWD